MNQMRSMLSPSGGTTSRIPDNAAQPVWHQEKTMFVITGVTGNVGGQIAKALRAKGLPVRAVLRDAAKAAEWRSLGCETALAAMNDAAALARAFADAEAVFVLLPPVFDPT